MIRFLHYPSVLFSHPVFSALRIPLFSVFLSTPFASSLPSSRCRPLLSVSSLSGSAGPPRRTQPFSHTLLFTRFACLFFYLANLFYPFFSASKRTKSCRQQKIRGSAAPRAETDASRETAAACARSGGALFCRGSSDRVIRLLSVPGKAFILWRSWSGPPFFFRLYARPQSLSVLYKVFQPQFPRGERFASYPFLHTRFHILASSLIFKRRILFPQLFRNKNTHCSLTNCAG